MTFHFFLQDLFAWLNPSKKYVLILDNAAFHKTKIIKDLIGKHDGWIVVEHIPPYSPELNPIETCWKVTKNAVILSQHFKTIDPMQEALESFWRKHTFTQDLITYLCR